MGDGLQNATRIFCANHDVFISRFRRSPLQLGLSPKLPGVFLHIKIHPDISLIFVVEHVAVGVIGDDVALLHQPHQHPLPLFPLPAAVLTIAVEHLVRVEEEGGLQ